MSVPLLVSTDWLADHVGNADLRIADVRWSLLEPDKGRRLFREAHVPGAVFLDLDRDLASPRGEGPGRHPLPRADRFAEAMGRAGIGEGTHVVAYDGGDGSTAARLWWLLRFFGHDRVSLLDGGFARWSAEGRAVEGGEASVASATFVARPQADRLVDAHQVEWLRQDPHALVIDSRAAERYEGKVEPIDPVAGHVPGAKNRPFATNVRSPEDPRFLDRAVLREAFTTLGAAAANDVVCYCGSGVNACQNVFALELAGFPGAKLYEGSWSDWCSDPSRKVATGPTP